MLFFNKNPHIEVGSFPFFFISIHLSIADYLLYFCEKFQTKKD